MKNPLEYEKILKLALNIMSYKDLKQEMLNDSFCLENNFDKLKFLLKNGVNINTQSCIYADTKLINTLKTHYYTEESLRTIIYLLEQGADVNRVNNQGQSALDIYATRRK